ncbi:hypothetical protein THAOC_03555 [Thalassiosira oceanica]|uniref:Uncharacterized protein n=1 Tax=Thalassiosira oceanica TaxID=159749 RepID=K0TB87_THAOC|nr:hypothetical protein THAOC_03555 [Thalassiosira oceanica]|eukprot:EJK74750.1 hypothetical protein THAOC_03555 [Thalassiosira oceanica]
MASLTIPRYVSSSPGREDRKIRVSETKRNPVPPTGPTGLLALPSRPRASLAPLTAQPCVTDQPIFSASRKTVQEKTPETRARPPRQRRRLTCDARDCRERYNNCRPPPSLTPSDSLLTLCSLNLLCQFSAVLVAGGRQTNLIVHFVRNARSPARRVANASCPDNCQLRQRAPPDGRPTEEAGDRGPRGGTLLKKCARDAVMQEEGSREGNFEADALQAWDPFPLVAERRSPVFVRPTAEELGCPRDRRRR